MNEIALPTAIQAFIDTTNAADNEGFVNAFTDDAVLNDWGRVFHGHEGIASWNSTDNIGVQSHFTAKGIEPGDAPDSYSVSITVAGNGFNGTGPMVFILHDSLIASLVIS